MPMTDTRFVEVKRGCTGAPPILPEWLLPPIALWLGEAGELLLVAPDPEEEKPLL